MTCALERTYIFVFYKEFLMAQHEQGSGSSNLLVILAAALIAFVAGYVIGNKTATPGGAGTDEAVQGAAALPSTLTPLGSLEPLLLGAVWRPLSAAPAAID